MPKANKAADQISKKELAEAMAIVKAIATQKKEGAVIFITTCEDKDCSKKKTCNNKKVNILSNKFSHKDMHDLISSLIRVTHPEIEAISSLFGGLARAAAASSKETAKSGAKK